MLDHRLRRWPNVKPALGQCVVFAGLFPIRVRKYKRCSLFMRYEKIQPSSKEQGVRLKAHTLFIGRGLYFHISHSNEHRLHILSVHCNDTIRSRILVQVTINRRLLIGRDGHLDQSEAYDKS